MADFILALTTLTAVALGMHVAWRRLAGRPSTLVRALGRTLTIAFLALVVVAAGTYHLSKSRSFQLAGDLVSHVETEDKLVALTFDDGPDPDHTRAVLDTLRAHDASATFYLTGAESERHPEQVREIVAEGHELGNHTYDHTRLLFLPASQVAEELSRTDEALRSAGYDGAISFRPPGCKRLLTAPLLLAGTGRQTVTWDLEPDSIGGIAGDADAITRHVVDRVTPGSIILMHVMYDSRQPSRDALPEILEQLSAEGYRFVTVSELQRSSERPAR